MASYLSTFSMIFVLLAIPFMLSPSHAITDEELQQICSNNDYPALCLQALKSNPQTPMADFYGMADISLGLSNATAYENYAMFLSLSNTTTDKQVKSRVKMCVTFYDLAIGVLESANEYLIKPDYLFAESHAESCWIWKQIAAMEK